MPSKRPYENDPDEDNPQEGPSHRNDNAGTYTNNNNNKRQRGGNGEKRFRCALCERSYKYNRDLSRHWKKCHDSNENHYTKIRCIDCPWLVPI